MLNLREKLTGILASGSTADHRRPVIGKGNESNVKGLHIIGDLAGAPVIKLAMGQGVEIIDYIAEVLGGSSEDADVLDVLIVGAGAAGQSAITALVMAAIAMAARPRYAGARCGRPNGIVATDRTTIAIDASERAMPIRACRPRRERRRSRSDCTRRRQGGSRRWSRRRSQSLPPPRENR